MSSSFAMYLTFIYIYYLYLFSHDLFLAGDYVDEKVAY